MINGKSILALIPARGGSKGLPGKNIKLLAGKPLIAWSIIEAQRSKYIDRIVVSTDSDEIASISKEYGAEVPFIRPAELATDEAKVDDAIVHAIDSIKNHEHIVYDYLLLLQPTSPLRRVEHIDNAFEKLIADKKASSLVSVTEVKEDPFLMTKISGEGYLERLIPGDFELRQSNPRPYMLNGAIYIVLTELFLKTRNFLAGDTAPFIMTRELSIDIDEKHEFDIAERLKARQRG